jgi:hypothetical protein
MPPQDADKSEVLDIRDGSGQRALTRLQRDFVREYVAGSGNATQAARNAGYTDDRADKTAWELLRLPHIQSAIREEQLRVIGTEGLAVGVGTLLQIAKDTGAPAGARVQAAKGLVDRALGAVTAAVPDKGQDGKPLTAQALAELRQGLAGDAAKLAELLGQAAGQAAAVVDLAPVAPDVAPELPAPKRRK